MKHNWTITKAQIAAGAIDDVILAVDPEQLSEAEIFGLQGGVRLRIEHTKGITDVFLNPEARVFFRKLHERWPWAAYFLRLSPVTNDSPGEKIIDLAIFMGLAFCHLEDLTLWENAHGIALRYDAGQLWHHLTELQNRAILLAETVGIPPDAIRRRDKIISSSVASFFKAGQALNLKNKNRNKKP